MKKYLHSTVFAIVLILGAGSAPLFAQTISQLFTATGTFTAPPCVTSIQVQTWGGGGGGGGSNSGFTNNAGGGGGGGGYNMSAAIAVIPGNSYTVTVGAGGTAGSGSDGGNGGSSSFNGAIVAPGGFGGVAWNSIGAGNGTGGLGAIGGIYNGGNGVSGSHPDWGGGGGGGAGSGGSGGNGGYPTGGIAGIGTQPGGSGGAGTNNAGLAGFIPGGGGGGALTLNPLGSSKSGGLGARGQVIITFIDPSPIIVSITGGGCPGSTITINGTNFSSASAATIGATALTNLVVTPTVITGIIAPGTTTGLVTVTTPCGTGTSASSFVVSPAIAPVSLGTQSICAGGSYSFGGQSYSAAGNYSDTTASTISGCDSITFVTLTVTSITTQSISQSICAGTSYNFGGQTYTAAGTYADTAVSTITGCDSITTLTLSVTPVTPQIVSQSICPGGSYNFHGNNYTAAGTYPITLAGAGMNGCDSIVSLVLSVNPYASSTINDSICFGGSYNFNGTICTTAGTYNDTLIGAAASGCDSTVTLILGVKSGSASTVTASTPLALFCSGDSTQICATSGFASYLWNTGQQGSCIYTRLAGNYYVTATDNNSCTVASNHVAIAVHPLPPVSISVNGDTLTAYNAVTYQWYRNGSSINNATSNIYIASQGGTYTVAVTDTNGCKAVSSPVIIAGIENLIEGEVTVYPNPSVNGSWELEVGTNLIGSEVEIFDADGRVVFQSEIRNQKSEIGLNVAHGVYLLRISSAKSNMVRKLIRL